VLGWGGLDPPPLLPPPLLLPLPPLGLPLSLGGLGLLLGGGGGVDDEGGGGVFGIVDGVGQVALASITDPSGHVFVVGDAGEGVNVCVQDGSFGFFVQSTGGAVPEVQLFTHVDPVLDPPDDRIDVLLGGIAADVLLGAGVAAVVVLVRLLAAELTGGRSLAHFNPAIVSSLNNASDMHFVYAFSGVSGKSLAQANPFLSSPAASAADMHFVYAFSSVGGQGPV
jgi:hypothetical protein